MTKYHQKSKSIVHLIRMHKLRKTTQVGRVHWKIAALSLKNHQVLEKINCFQENLILKILIYRPLKSWEENLKRKFWIIRPKTEENNLLNVPNLLKISSSKLLALKLPDHLHNQAAFLQQMSMSNQREVILLSDSRRRQCQEKK